MHWDALLWAQRELEILKNCDGAFSGWPRNFPKNQACRLNRIQGLSLTELWRKNNHRQSTQGAAGDSILINSVSSGAEGKFHAEGHSRSFCVITRYKILRKTAFHGRFYFVPTLSPIGTSGTAEV